MSHDLIRQVTEALRKYAPLAAPSLAPLEPETLVTRECRHGMLTYAPEDLWVGRALDIYGNWSEGEVDLFRKVLKPGESVIEVGANIGAHTVALAEIVGESGAVAAFEPNPETYRMLHANTKSLVNVLDVPIALGATDGRATVSRKTNNFGGATITADAHGMCVVGTVDGLVGCQPIAFLKLDCEGSELEVLKGAERTIARCRPLLYAENDRLDKSDALIDWIHDRDYHIYEHRIPLFRADNFRGYRINIFENVISLMLFCVPNEDKSLRPAEWGMGLERMRVC